MVGQWSRHRGGLGLSLVPLKALEEEGALRIIGIGFCDGQDTKVGYAVTGVHESGEGRRCYQSCLNLDVQWSKTQG